MAPEFWGGNQFRSRILLLRQIKTIKASITTGERLPTWLLALCDLLGEEAAPTLAVVYQPKKTKSKKRALSKDRKNSKDGMATLD